jgi:flagellar biosynthesis regulator FlaF
MYQFDYPVIADDLPRHPPHCYTQKLNLAIELIDLANASTCSGHDRMRALSEVRRLWISIGHHVMRTDRAALEACRSMIASSMQAVVEEIDARRAEIFQQSGLCKIPRT